MIHTRRSIRPISVLLGALLLLPAQLPAQATTEAMLEVLVRAPGWRAEWSGPGGSGITDVVFERTAAGITAKIHLITPFDMTCENPVTVAPGRITFDGCRDPAVSLTYDPSNPDLPFQGGSPRGYAWKLRPK